MPSENNRHTCDKKNSNNANDGNPALDAGERVPLELDPSVRRELSDDPLDLAPVGGNLVQSSPVVLLISD